MNVHIYLVFGTFYRWFTLNTPVETFIYLKKVKVKYKSYVKHKLKFYDLLLEFVLLYYKNYFTYTYRFLYCILLNIYYLLCKNVSIWYFCAIIHAE